MNKPLLILLALATLPLGACADSNGRYGYGRPGHASDRHDRHDHRGHDRDRRDDGSSYR